MLSESLLTRIDQAAANRGISKGDPFGAMDQT